MRKHNYTLSILIGLLAFVTTSTAQPTIYPAPKQKESIRLDGATVHTGTGEALENASVCFADGVITYVGETEEAPEAAQIIDAGGKHIYPGFIISNTDLGLVEFESVKATVDFQEIGQNNAHVRSLIAYNTDSKVIGTLRSNGMLLAQITPVGGVISGQSSVVQLDAWNWEDAAYKIDEGIHLHWPTLQISPFRTPTKKEKKEAREKNETAKKDLISFLEEAKKYAELDRNSKTVNPRLQAFEEVFANKRKVYLHADKAQDIQESILALQNLGITPVLVGGNDAHQVTEILKQYEIPVILNQPHRLPSRDDEDVYLPYKQAHKLMEEGILVALSMKGFWQQRNLAFMAGTASAYGVPYEDAVSMITLNPAKIMGIDDKTGSIEVGKDANLIVSKGDALDMMGNDIQHAFITGREINLDNLHKQLYERYQHKYESAASED